MLDKRTEPALYAAIVEILENRIAIGASLSAASLTDSELETMMAMTVLDDLQLNNTLHSADYLCKINLPMMMLTVLRTGTIEKDYIEDMRTYLKEYVSDEYHLVSIDYGDIYEKQI